jgi:hypothetical protein
VQKRRSAHAAPVALSEAKEGVDLDHRSEQSRCCSWRISALKLQDRAKQALGALAERDDSESVRLLVNWIIERA